MVNFGGPTILREHIEVLARIGEVRQLRIAETDLTDDDLLRLPDLPGLDLLSVTASSIDGRFLAGAAKFPDVEKLTLQADSFKESNLRFLRLLPKLTEIELKDTPITDDGAIVLAGYSRLKHIGLANTRVGSRGVEAIAQLPFLESLDLGDTDLGDEGAISLWRLSTLNRLDLEGTNVSAEGIERIQSAIPSCKITN